MNYDNKIILGDCLEGMKNMPENSVDVSFTSPPYGLSGKTSFQEQKNKNVINPYNVKMKYLSEEKFIGKDWLDWQIKIINEMLRVTKKIYHL